MEILDLFNDHFQPKSKTFQTDVTNENKRRGICVINTE
jgi:hypothetical protein